MRIQGRDFELKKLMQHPIAAVKLPFYLKNEEKKKAKSLDELNIKLALKQEGIGSRRRSDKIFNHEKEMIKAFNYNYTSEYGQDYYNIWLETQPKEYKKEYCTESLHMGLKDKDISKKDIENCLKIIISNKELSFKKLILQDKNFNKNISMIIKF